MKSFYWFDFETFGIDPATDWPSQFAGIRTDADLNEIGEPLNIYCRLPEDHLPHPMAALVTRLSPQEVNAEGLVEPEFIGRIHDELMQPGTCALGYNTIRFDDEVVRHSLYRNFYDPYAREWQNGNSRWDLIDLVRLTGALRPEGINWPKREDGFTSYKLDDLTSANGIDFGDAHDALVDVRATIALAKLIRERQPKVFNFILNNRGKREVAQLLNLAKPKPVVHVSGMFGAARQSLAIVMPIAAHPINKNGVVVYDLAVDPTPLFELSVEEIQERLFTRREEGDERERIPLKVVHLNKCPVIAPLSVLRDEDKTRLKLDMSLYSRHFEQLTSARDLVSKVQAVFANPPERHSEDPDQQLYSGGFFSPDDKDRMQRIRSARPEDLGQLGLSFDDGRLDEMLFRYRARNYPGSLTSEEQSIWVDYRRQRLEGGDRVLGFHGFWEALDALQPEADREQKALLGKLAEYARQLQAGLA